MSEDEDETEVLLPNVKPMLIQCACGKWQFRLYFDDDAMLYCTETWCSKTEAAAARAERIVDLGIEYQKIN